MNLAIDTTTRRGLCELQMAAKSLTVGHTQAKSNCEKLYKVTP